MRGALLLLLAAACAAAAAAAPGQGCEFQSRQPRFWSVRSPLTALDVAPDTAFFLSDALLRTLTRQLGLAQCQVRARAAACAAAQPPSAGSRAVR